MSAGHLRQFYNLKKLGAMIDLLGKWTKKYQEFGELYDSVADLSQRFQEVKKLCFVPGKLAEFSSKYTLIGMLDELTLIWGLFRYQWFIHHDDTLVGLLEDAAEVDSIDSLIARFEKVVEDEAMLDLEVYLTEEEMAGEKFQVEVKLDFCRKIGFAYIVASKPGALRAEELMKLFDSDFLDSYTKQLFVSAIMLGCINFYDRDKMQVLRDIVRGNYELEMTQRALVGFVLVGLACPSDFGYVDSLADLSEDESFRRQVGEIQRVMHLEESADKIGGEVLASFMKGIFSHAALELTERMKEKTDVVIDEDVPYSFERDFKDGFEKIVSKEEEGADVYYAQFKKVKTADFFDSVYNWFMPFYDKNPHLKEVQKVLDAHDFLRHMNECSAMCDCDIYSFLLSMREAPDEAIRQLRPQNGGMIGEEECLDDEDLGDEDMGDEDMGDEEMGANPQLDEKVVKAKILRTYIHDLFRFFELSSMRSSFINPFEINRYQPLLLNVAYKDRKFDKQRLSMARFGAKHKDYEFTDQMLSLEENPTVEQNFMQAVAGYGLKQYDFAVEVVEELLKQGAKKKACLLLLLENYEKLRSDKFPYVVEQLLEDETDEQEKFELKLRLLDFYIDDNKEDSAKALAYQMDCDYPKSEQVECRLAEVLMFSHPYNLENVKRASMLLAPYADNGKNEQLSELLHGKKPGSEEEASKMLMNMLAMMLNNLAKPAGDSAWRKRVARRMGMCLWVLEGGGKAYDYIADSFSDKEATMYLGVPTYDIDKNDRDWLFRMGVPYIEIDMMLENVIRPSISK